MGRRSINTTKSGKFMNPTDQARKEARKKELKKNRKQRQMVRAAVLKGKDPNQLIVDMEKIDEMEYDVNNPPSLNEKVLKEKRKKLRDTFQRIMKLYEKEDREQWVELKKLEHEYERKRNKMIHYFESVKHAEQVKLEEIPLPNFPGELAPNAASQIPLPGDIPLPSGPLSIPPQSILKKGQSFPEIPVTYKSGKKPPGVPPGPPPELSDVDDNEDFEGFDEDKSKKIRFQDEESNKSGTGGLPKAKGGGLDINEFLKEVEAEHIQKVEESEDFNSEKTDDRYSSTINSVKAIQMPPGPPPGAPPTHVMYNRPPLTNVRPMVMPPGPPPRLLPPGPPPGPPPGMPPRMSGPPLRLPPGPPPGLPPRVMRPPTMMQQHQTRLPPPTNQSSNVLSAPPSLISKPGHKIMAMSNSKAEADDKKASGGIIEAKPQLRNLSADVTKFMPTSLRIKREEKTIKKKEQIPMSLGIRAETTSMVPQARQTTSVKGRSRDDAYDQFMKEMEGLL